VPEQAALEPLVPWASPHTQEVGPERQSRVEVVHQQKQPGHRQLRAYRMTSKTWLHPARGWVRDVCVSHRYGVLARREGGRGGGTGVGAVERLVAVALLRAAGHAALRVWGVTSL
jgi:hypothetical protein